MPTSHDPFARIKMTGLGLCFVTVAGMLFAFQPGQPSNQMFAEATPVAPAPVVPPAALPDPAASTTAALEIAPESFRSYAPTESLTPVARFNSRLLDAGGESASRTLRRLLRQPLRVGKPDATFTSLGPFVSETLTDLGYGPQDGTRLRDILVQAITEGQSDAYIDALLNRAVARGEMRIPAGLQNGTGGIETGHLLDVLVRKARL